MKAADCACPPEWRADLDRFLETFQASDLVFAPIRHHSPACAWHLARLIHDLQPATVLVEGPSSMDTLTPLLADPELTPPVAICFRRSRQAEGSTFFPFCAYSPEWIALREAKAIGARFGWIDLEPGPESAGRMCDDQAFLHSRFLESLASREGCRDSHEFWDRRFESAFRQENTSDFWRRIAAYGFLARLSTPEESLQRDGTLAREAFMLDQIRAERKRNARRKNPGPLLVVTGAFHTPALLANRMTVAAPTSPTRSPDRLPVLIPYSFREMDPFHGYGAGMPHPGYYQRLWMHPGGNAATVLQEVAAEILTDLARHSREDSHLQALSTADLAAAHQQACLLAAFRGNPGPLREDLLDGIRSSFVKGSLDADGKRILDLAHQQLCGDQVGRVPSGTPLHPLVSDFRGRCQELGLRLDSSLPQTRALDIYRKPRHLRISQFLHLLEVLEIPFARFLGGPDFVRGRDLDLLIEHWELTWSPQLETQLLLRAQSGTTLQEVLEKVLHVRAAEIEARHSGGSAEAVALPLVCLRLGLGQLAEAFTPLVARRIQREDRFDHAAETVGQLSLLQQMPGPFATEKPAALSMLLCAAYERACLLMDNFPSLHAEQAETALRQTHLLLSALAADSGGCPLDSDRFWNACSTLTRSGGSGLDPLLLGGLLGWRWRNQPQIGPEVTRLLRVQDAEQGGFSRFLCGLLQTRRELTWLDEPLMRALTEILQTWDDALFTRNLPGLRLAFADLTPSETDQAAKLIARVLGGNHGIAWHMPAIEESLATRCMDFAAHLETVLAEEHLEHFLPHETH